MPCHDMPCPAISNMPSVLERCLPKPHLTSVESGLQAFLSLDHLRITCFFWALASSVSFFGSMPVRRRSSCSCVKNWPCLVFSAAARKPSHHRRRQASSRRGRARNYAPAIHNLRPTHAHCAVRIMSYGLRAATRPETGTHVFAVEGRRKLPLHLSHPARRKSDDEMMPVKKKKLRC